MTPSKTIKNFIKEFEQCRLRAFLPTPNDVPTIGWGRTKGVRLGMVQTQADADADFDKDIAERAAAITAALAGAPTTQNQFDAMVSLAYNIGTKGTPTKPGLILSTLFRKHKAGDFAGARAEFAKWNKQAGKVLRGLTTRRAAEAKVYGS